MKLLLLFLLVCLGFIPGVVGASFPVLFLSSASDSFFVGDTFFVDVVIDTQGNAVNAVASYLSYPDELLEPVSVEMAGSPMEIIVERNYGLGRVEISGGTPTPGFVGVHLVATIEFRAISAGTASLEFLPDSAVMTDVGNENIFEGNSGAAYEIMSGTPQASQENEPSVSRYVYTSPIETFAAHSLLASLLLNVSVCGIIW